MSYRIQISPSFGDAPTFWPTLHIMSVAKEGLIDPPIRWNEGGLHKNNQKRHHQMHFASFKCTKMHVQLGLCRKPH